MLTIKGWVAGVLELAAMGSAHEVDEDEDLAEFSVETEAQRDGTLVLTTEDGRRFRVSVEEIK